MTVPKEIREGLRLKTGDRMPFTLLPDGTALMRMKEKTTFERRQTNLYRRRRVISD